MTVFDVGASVGFQAGLAARLVGGSGRVIDFEPHPENAARARHNARLNDFRHLEVLEVAVAAADGEARFRRSEGVNWGKLDASGALEVKVRSLDSVAAERSARPAAIKIDVEGGELGVLDGARRLLAEAAPILFIDCHGTNAGLAERLEPLGYRLVVLGGEGLPLREGSQRQVVLLTDGLIGFEREIIDTLMTRLPEGVRVHAVGVGSGINRSLTQAVARAGRGTELIIGIGEDAERLVSRLVARTTAPLVTDLRVEGQGVVAIAPR
jgi:FkbM family methyltransferase